MSVHSVARALAILLIAVSAVTLAVGVLLLVFANRDLQRSQECQFNISAEVNAIGDRIDQATARGLVALAEEDQQGLVKQVAIIREQTGLLEPAIEERERAVEVCQ